MPTEETLESRCRREILELHAFFQGWYNGTLEKNDTSFVRLRDVLADRFSIVTPDGRTTERVELLMEMRRAHGSWRKEGQPTARIWVDDIRLNHLEDDLALLSYEEWQLVHGSKRGRMSTALLRRREGTPNGVEWIHVHEVWLP